MGYRGITTDITRHYEAEQKLRQSEARFRAMFNSSSVAINLASDRAGNIIYWNRAAELTFGYKEAEVLGQPISLLMPERYRHAHQKGFKHALATEEYRVIGKTVELVGLRKNGEEFEIELSLSTWDQGPDKYFSAVIHDISERKRFERELIENRKRAEAASLAKSEFLASHES